MLQIQSGELLRDCGNSLKKKGYTIKVLNLDEKSHSNHYNPIVYVKKQETFYDILEYDVVNVYRFGSSQQTSIDIGAYQSGDDSYSYYNNIGHPLMRKNCHNYSNEKKPIWSQSPKVFVDNKQKTQVGLILYNMSGQMVYETSLNEGLNTISTSLSAGTYIVRTISAGGDNNYTKILITK